MLLLDHEPTPDEVRIQAQANQREELSLLDQQQQFADSWQARTTSSRPSSMKVVESSTSRQLERLTGRAALANAIPARDRVLVLGLWPAVALSVIAAVDLIHLSERRHRPH